MPRGRPKGTFATVPRSAHVHETLRLRAAGLPFAEIGRRLGITAQAAHQHVKRWTGRRHAAPTQERTPT